MSLKKFLANALPDKFPAPIIDPCFGDHALRQAAAAAVARAYYPAEAYLTAIKDWDDRAFALSYFSQCGEGEGWCDAWHDAVPGSNHAPAVHGFRLVELAWQARGGGWTPNAGGFQTFQTLLAEASRAFDEAAERWPEDPCPWSGLIRVAIGLQQGLATANAHFDQARRRAPHHIDAHECLLQASCVKWGGSDQAMMAHAVNSAAHAPAGHPLHAIPLLALRERALLRQIAGDKAGAAAVWNSPEATRFCDAAISNYVRSPSRRPRRDDARFAGIVAFACAKLGRHTDAIAAFEVSGPWLSERVWGDGENGVNNFARTRRECHAMAR